MNDSILLRKQATDFFLYAYFGIIVNDDYRTIIKKCVKRAYLDMNRTLKVKSDVPGFSFQEEFAERMTEIIVSKDSITDIQSECYKLFIDYTEGNDQPQKGLYAFLGTKEIKDKSKRRGNCFYFGQAQKWINMSLKYLWLLGIINDDETKGLDVPIDSIIMLAASEELGVVYPTDSKKQIWKAYSPSSTMPWSKLNSSEYKTIQNTIKVKIKEKNPIEWESDKWIEYAEKKKNHISA